MLVWDPARRLERAKSYFDAAASINPEHVGLLQSLGMYHAMKGDRVASVDCWTEAYRKDPDFTQRRLRGRRVRELMRRIGIQDVDELLSDLRENR